MPAVNQIPELQMSHVKISKPDRVEEKLSKMSREGNETIHIIFDYDRTLSKPDPKRDPDFGTLDVFATIDSVPDRIKDGIRKMWVDMTAVLTNPQASLDYIVTKIQESVVLYEGYLAELPPSVNLEAIETESIRQFILRDGVKECFNLLKNNSIPVTIISAGLGEAIDATLVAQEIKQSNVRVIANYLKFKDDKILGFANKYIHVFNKNEEAMKSTKHSQELSKRENIILVGDCLTDVRMAESAPETATKLTIGFLNKNSEEDLKKFMDTFDIVIIEDMSMAVVNGILRYIL